VPTRMAEVGLIVILELPSDMTTDAGVLITGGGLLLTIEDGIIVEGVLVGVEGVLVEVKGVLVGGAGSIVLAGWFTLAGWLELGVGSAVSSTAVIVGVGATRDDAGSALAEEDVVTAVFEVTSLGEGALVVTGLRLDAGVNADGGS
jgi:hypothetical protein